MPILLLSKWVRLGANLQFCSVFGGQSVKLTSTFQMNNEGLSTGIFNFDTGDSGIMPSIKLDQGKTSMAGVSIITSGSSVGTMSILQFIKESNIGTPWIPSLLLDD